MLWYLNSMFKKITVSQCRSFKMFLLCFGIVSTIFYTLTFVVGKNLRNTKNLTICIAKKVSYEELVCFCVMYLQLCKQ